MGIGVQFERLAARDDDREQVGDFLLDRARIGPAQAKLELGPSATLPGGHRAAPAALALGEAVEEVRRLAYRDVIARGVELAPLEALEAVEGQRLAQDPARAVRLMKEQAVPAEPGTHAGDRVRGHPMLPGDLAKSRAAQEAMEHRKEQLGPAQPVGRREGLIAELSTAGDAAVTLDPLWGGLPGVE